jgi:spore maturation protein CgeB
MSRKFRMAYFAHAIRSDWNNGNAHFLRGLLRHLGACGHEVTAFEPLDSWSMNNLRLEDDGDRSLRNFADTYPDLRVIPYRSDDEQNRLCWRRLLRETEVVILHEWNPPVLASQLLQLRDELGFRLLFHDTHHRASSSPEEIERFEIHRFDGVLAFGEALREIYRRRFNIARVWTLHEAADTSVFRPLPRSRFNQDVVWIGNWGDNERSQEIREFLLRPAELLGDCAFSVYGVRYPAEALAALQKSGVRYGDYLPNLDGPSTYAASKLTVHIPRQQYASAMAGIPTVRVFEALACGIPLVSAPWDDLEHLFNEGDLLFANNARDMQHAIEMLLSDPGAAAEQAARGLATVLARHTCRHRAEQLTSICEELFG